MPGDIAPDIRNVLALPEVHRRSSARRAVRAAIARSVHTFCDELPATHRGDDPEALHQARVAIRRLRSDLRTFTPLLDPAWSADLRAELRWLGGSLGEVRDLDVLTATLASIVDDEDLVRADDAAPLLEFFERQRAERRAALVDDLDSTRCADLMLMMFDAVKDPPTTSRATEPAADVLPQLMERPWIDLHRAVRRLGAESGDAELHQVRILAKRCRYAADAVALTVGKPARRFSKAMGRIQECLGDLNDAVVIGERLRAVATEVPEVGFVAGQLSGILARRAAHCRSDFPDVWSRSWHPRLRRWW